MNTANLFPSFNYWESDLLPYDFHKQGKLKLTITIKPWYDYYLLDFIFAH